jgi:hypothetical protein
MTELQISQITEFTEYRTYWKQHTDKIKQMTEIWEDLWNDGRVLLHNNIKKVVPVLN